MSTGPFETEAEARETAAVQEIHRAFRAEPGVGKMQPHTLAMLIETCAAAGVEMGSFDRRVLAWLSNWEAETAVVVAGIIIRAHDAGRSRTGPKSS
jgi:hypothetical protein